MLRLHRGNLRTLLIILAVIFYKYSPEFFNIGYALFFLGLLLHFISKGFLYRNLELATFGPYSFIRHPFYAANMLLDIGVILMAGRPAFILIYLVLYYVSYHRVILEEELNLTNIYCEKYLKYIQKVPRYFPSLIPYEKNWYEGFKWENIIRERQISRSLRLAMYPILFLMLHELLKYKHHQRNIEILLFGSGICLLLFLSSRLFYRAIERDRISKETKTNITGKLLFAYFPLLALALLLLRFFETENRTLVYSLAGSMAILGLLFLNKIQPRQAAKYFITRGIDCALIPAASCEVFSRRYKNIFGRFSIGDYFIITAFCVYSGLLWIIPFALAIPIAISILSYSKNSKPALIPLAIRGTIYVLFFVILTAKEYFIR